MLVVLNYADPSVIYYDNIGSNNTEEEIEKFLSERYNLNEINYMYGNNISRIYYNDKLN